jgi:hypothetical protein
MCQFLFGTVVHTFAQDFHRFGRAPLYLVGFVLDTTGHSAQNSRKVFVWSSFLALLGGIPAADRRHWGKVDAVHAWIYGSMHQRDV